jgi:hypothetical protein
VTKCRPNLTETARDVKLTAGLQSEKHKISRRFFLYFKLSSYSECCMLSSGCFTGVCTLHVNPKVSQHSVCFIFVPTRVWRRKRESIAKLRYLNYRRRWITQKKAHSIACLVYLCNAHLVYSFYFNPLYTLADVTRHTSRSPIYITVQYSPPQHTATSTQGKPIVLCNSTVMFIVYQPTNVYVILSLIVCIAEYPDCIYSHANILLISIIL